MKIVDKFINPVQAKNKNKLYLFMIHISEMIFV